MFLWFHSLTSSAKPNQPLLLLNSKVRTQHQHVLGNSSFDPTVRRDEVFYLQQQLSITAVGIFEY